MTDKTVTVAIFNQLSSLELPTLKSNCEIVWGQISTGLVATNCLWVHIMKYVVSTALAVGGGLLQLQIHHSIT